MGVTKLISNVSKTMKRLLTYLLCSLMLLLVADLQAQGDKVTIEKDGKTYYVHTVEQGHTLYGISKLYNTTVETITAENPMAKDGLQIGQTLYIPAQGEVNSDVWTNPVRIEGGFMIHRVKRKETLYGISRQYNCDINRILELNPGVELSLQPGTELKIPQNDLDMPSTEVIEPGPNDGWEKHLVQMGETLYGISRKYGVDPDEIEKLNGGLPAGLKAGEEILIPIRNELFVQQTEEIEYNLEMKDTVFIKSRYNVVVMMPFGLQTAFIEEGEEGFDREGKTERLREISMSFYRGMTFALDSLKKRGANLNVTFIDATTEADVLSALQRDEVKNADLIIGPLQRKSIEKVSSYASRKGIHVVCPVPQSNKVLLSNPNLSKVFPSMESEMKAMAEHVANTHAGENVILINSKDVKDARMVQLFKKYYDQALKASPNMTLQGYTEIEGSSKFVGEFEAKLSKAQRNIIVVPAGNQSRSMIANLQSKIQLLNEEEFQVLMYAPDDWLNYDFLEITYKNRTQLAVPSAQYLDYENPSVTHFADAYQKEFQVDPSKYAFLGYDIMMFYGCGLIQYGINFPNNFESIDRSGLLHIAFDYRKTGMESGYENEHVYLLRHHEMKLENLHAH